MGKSKKSNIIESEKWPPKHPCVKCRFFYPFGVEDDGKVHEGWCNRFPPVYIGRPFDIEEHVDEMDTECWVLPVVGIYNTCGEWRKVKHGKGR